MIFQDKLISYEHECSFFPVYSSVQFIHKLEIIRTNDEESDPISVDLRNGYCTNKRRCSSSNTTNNRLFQRTTTNSRNSDNALNGLIFSKSQFDDTLCVQRELFTYADIEKILSNKEKKIK